MEPDGGALDIEMGLVLDAIERRYGYDLRAYMPDSMHRRLKAALARSGFAHFGELQHRLLHDPAWFSSLLDQLTVQVSDMFRDPVLYRTLRERVAPVLRTYPSLKIWHAGCSAGEEVYATAILLEELSKAGFLGKSRFTSGRSAGETKVSQAFIVLLPVRSVGVMGDQRTYQEAAAIRAVTTEDFMTADWARLPHELLARVSSRIVNEVDGINRVVYDITSKPPATIEWE